MVYVGIDNGSKKLGISFIDTESRLWYGTTLLREKGKASKFDPATHPYQLWEQLEHALNEFAPKKLLHDKGIVVGIERYFLQPGRGKAVLPWLQGFMMSGVYLFYDKKLKAEVVDFDAWKRVLIGYKTIAKEMVEAFVYRRAQTENLKMKIDTPLEDKQDTYDAMGISYYLWKKYSSSNK